MALLFLGCLPYSAFCDTVGGTTSNVAANGFQWDMLQFLPPEVGLTVNLIQYEYTVDKKKEDDFSVTISNKNALADGNIFSNTDDWSGKSGQTIDRDIPIGNIPAKFWGIGSLTTTGDGEVSDVNIQYSFTFDNCINPEANPDCPQPVEDRELPLIENPFDSDAVQDALAKEADLDEEDDERKDEENELEDEDKRKKLAKDNNPLMKDAARLAALFDQMALVPQFDSYYATEIQGGTYEETIELKDGTLPDNRRGFKSLAEDKKFNTIIRSQYDR